MAKSIISLVLLLMSVFLNLRNGYSSFTSASNPESAKMIAELGIKVSYLPYIGITIMGIGLSLLFPKTFIIGNILNAVSFVIIIALALNAGNYKMALIEIPFFLMPLLLIWLKYPFKNN
jgi:hypothetical protein